jgi:hypothetical protein
MVDDLFVFFGADERMELDRRRVATGGAPYMVFSP